ncbi:MAG: SigB/SigF/SigG family RNA polymerase sigma factor [Bacillota bacterium]|nr:SigB/SigF/SigG family RNA polymerase sigma factor [Bacillota bacterium]
MGSDRPYPCKEATYDLVRRAGEGDEAAREALVSGNMGLVKSIALKFLGPGLELEDLIQIGSIGLLKAVDRFDVSYGVMFSTYAVPMILGEIRRFLRDDGRIKVGRRVKRDVQALRRLEEEFVRTKGRSPRVSELAEGMGLSVEEVLALIETGEAIYSLESLDDPERTDREEAEPYREAEQRQVDMIQIKAALRALGERERQVIVLRYFRDMTQQQIADRLGISQVQVSRIEKRVLEALRREMAE